MDESEEIESRRAEMAPVEPPKPRFVMFRIGQTIQIDGVTFRVRKVTPKDIVLRPLGKSTLFNGK